MKLSKVAFAVAGLMAIAGAAHAGQIDSSSSTLAIEVIKSDAQVVRAPSKAYNFAGDIDATTNEQRLQLQYTLDNGGKWPVGTLTSTAPVAGAGFLKLVSAAAPATAIDMTAAGWSVESFLANDAKTLVFNITVPSGTALIRNPIFTLNSADTVGTTNTGITALYSVAGATACVADDKNLDISLKHFTNHTGGLTVMSNASPDSEHVRSGNVSSGRLLNFTQNLKLDFTPAANAAQTDANFINQRLLGTNYANERLRDSTGNAASTALVVAPTVSLPATQFLLGSVRLTARSTGLDLNYAQQYGKGILTVAPGAGSVYGPYDNANFTFPTAAAVPVLPTDSSIELKDAAVVVTLPTAWPADAALILTDGQNAATVLTATWSADRKTATFTATTPAQAAVVANGGYIWGQFTGATAIPQTAGVSVVATLNKAPAAATGADLSEQNNSCSGSLTGIGGGIKIDVRNYATYATYGDAGPKSFVRLINNSESQAADIYGQIIYGNGMYGPWGKLGELAPRAAKNMTSPEIEALLTNAAAASNPFGTSTVYTNDAAATTQANKGGAGNGDRLRIVSNTGSTLRVQSFILYPNGSVLDTSSAQGVDFENTANNRTPANAIDGQPISQDAINGLGR